MNVSPPTGADALPLVSVSLSYWNTHTHGIDGEVLLLSSSPPLLDIVVVIN